jgi:hypothetical protein
MLIKFDHLTYVVSKQDYAKAHGMLNGKGYKLMFAEKDLVNISPKKPFLRYPTATHDLYYYESTAGVPIEVVSYDRVYHSQSSIIYNFEENELIIPATDINLVMGCLNSIGAKQLDDERVSLSGLLDRKIIVATIVPKHETDVYLDSEGFRCPTVIVDSYEKIHNAVCLSGGECSSVEGLKVNGRNLRIFFVSVGGVVLELISSK